MATSDALVTFRGGFVAQLAVRRAAQARGARFIGLGRGPTLAATFQSDGVLW